MAAAMRAARALCSPEAALASTSSRVSSPPFTPAGPPLLEEEVLYCVSSGNKKAAFCSGLVDLNKPSDGLEPSTPSLPWRCSTN
jgi:hypothetical protein